MYVFEEVNNRREKCTFALHPNFAHRDITANSPL